MARVEAGRGEEVGEDEVRLLHEREVRGLAGDGATARRIGVGLALPVEAASSSSSSGPLARAHAGRVLHRVGDPTEQVRHEHRAPQVAGSARMPMAKVRDTAGRISSQKRRASPPGDGGIELGGEWRGRHGRGRRETTQNGGPGRERARAGST
jgi:hypothetical protein